MSARVVFSLLFVGLAACHEEAAPPPHAPDRIAGPGEPCYTPPKPWDDPSGVPLGNASNLPRCQGRVPDLRWAPNADDAGVRPRDAVRRSIVVCSPELQKSCEPSDAGL